MKLKCLQDCTILLEQGEGEPKERIGLKAGKIVSNAKIIEAVKGSPLFVVIKDEPIKKKEKTEEAPKKTGSKKKKS